MRLWPRTAVRSLTFICDPSHYRELDRLATKAQGARERSGLLGGAGRHSYFCLSISFKKSFFGKGLKDPKTARHFGGREDVVNKDVVNSCQKVRFRWFQKDGFGWC